MFALQAQAQKLNANNTGLHVSNEERLTRIQSNVAHKNKRQLQGNTVALFNDASSSVDV